MRERKAWGWKKERKQYEKRADSGAEMEVTVNTR